MAQRRDTLESPRVKELKRQRIQSKKKKILLWTVGSIVLLTGLAFASHLRVMRIERVTISGNTVVNSDVILEKVQDELFGRYLFAFSKQNFLLYPKNSIEKHLLGTLKRLETVKVTLTDTHTLSVKVSEREGRYLWCGHTFSEEIGDVPNDECYYMDTSGYIFSKSPYFTGNVYIKFFGTGLFSPSIDPIGRQYLPIEQFAEIETFLSGLPALGIEPYALRIIDGGDYDLYIASLEPGRLVYTKILFNEHSDPKKLLENLSAALKAEQFKNDFTARFNDLLYIDLRFASKVYYKFRPTTPEF
jgi:hypothetical protein